MEVSEFTFARSDTTEVVAAMQRLSQTGEGLGWVNIGPALREDQLAALPAPTALGRWFSGRGPAVPMGTWTPPRSGRRPTPAVVGLEHGTGPKALQRLASAGVGLPEGWRKVQDHAKTGIVAQPHPSTPHAAVVDWLLDACERLCVIELDGHWMARVHMPR